MTRPCRDLKITLALLEVSFCTLRLFGTHLLLFERLLVFAVQRHYLNLFTCFLHYAVSSTDFVIYSWLCWPYHGSGTYSSVTRRRCGHSVPDSQWTVAAMFISEVWLTPVSIPSLLGTFPSVTVAVWC
jgi:hypothetical protein